jgi:hypothetical protein
MAIKSNYQRGDAEKEFRKVQDEIDFEIIRAMSYAGEKFVKDARNMTKTQGGFGDVTGNLRSSIGYFILKDGEIIKSDTKQVSGPKGDGGEGLATAITELLFIENKTGFQLVGIAGMNYASAVETRGLNVITLQGDVMLIDLEKFYKILENRFK